MYSNLNFKVHKDLGITIDIKGDIYKVFEILVHRDVPVKAFIKEEFKDSLGIGRYFSTSRCYITSDYTNDEEITFKKGFAILIDEVVPSNKFVYSKEKQPHLSINGAISLGPNPEIKEFGKFENKRLKLRLILRNEYKEKFYVPCISFYKKAEGLFELPDQTFIDAKVIIILGKQSLKPTLVITSYNTTIN